MLEVSAVGIRFFSAGIIVMLWAAMKVNRFD